MMSRNVNRNVNEYLTSQNATERSCIPEQFNTRLENVPRFLPEEKTTGQNTNPAIQDWRLFITDGMLQDAVKYTNNEI